MNKFSKIIFIIFLVLLPNRNSAQGNSSGIKIGTSADGIYRVFGYQLESLGVHLNEINPSYLKIYLKDEEIPIYVSNTITNTFTRNDFIEFVGKRNLGGNHRSISENGKPYNEYLNRYSDTTIYWISWENSVGKRTTVINSNQVINTNVDTLEHYYQIDHFEQDNWFDFSDANLVRKDLPYWYENKTWGWSGLSVGIRQHTFTTTNLYPQKPIRLFAKLQSYATTIAKNSHHLAISLNSSPIVDSTFINQYSQLVLKGEFASNYINAGTNTLKIHSFATSSSINLCFFDWYEIEYPRYLIPRDGKLNSTFSFLNSRKEYALKIRNVTSTPYSLWIIGDRAKKYNLPVNNSQIFLVDTLDSAIELYFCEENKITSPHIFYQKKIVSLKDSSNKAEYLLITNKKFLNQAKDYAKFISNNYGVESKVVDVDDIYDQFAFGFFNPEAIRDFLKYAYNNWQSPKIKYVCLVGGATYDYHGNKAKYQGAPRFYNYVPSFGSPVSDSWFVIFDSTKTYVPEISIGRIPVTTNEEFEWYFEKHKKYVSQPFSAWNKRVIFFSGGTGNDQNQLNQLKGVNETIIQNYVQPKPYSAQYTHFYKTLNPINNFGPYTSNQISSIIDSGGVFISYLGHSGTQTWDNSITDPKQLQNKVERYPLITDFGCSTARFAEPDIISFSQAFVNSGQAIAYIGNSSLGFTSTSYNFPQLFYKKLLKDSVYTIGDAHRLAKQEFLNRYGQSGVYQLFALTNTLIGDPIVQLKVPPKPNLIITSNDIVIIDKSFSDTYDSIRVKINLYNYGLASDSTFKIRIEAFQNSLPYFSKFYFKALPSFRDSLIFFLPIKERNGLLKINVELDSEKCIDEIYETDNYTEFNFIVPSGSIKYFSKYSVENYLKNPIRIINPLTNTNSDTFLIDIATNERFTDKNTFNVLYDTAKTDYSISGNYTSKRIWLRSIVDNDDTNSIAISFKLSDRNSYALFDSMSFAQQQFSQFANKKSFYLDSTKIKFHLLSAGLNDGNTALILKNGQNFIPENTLRGHHVAIFKGKNFEFAGYKRFDVFGGGSTVTNEYIQFLDTLSSDYLVAIAISDEGTVSSSKLRNKIKEFGSKYIDNVGFRSSWAMLGRRGAPIGSVKEKYARQYSGRVEIDSVILSQSRSGSIITNPIGIASKWKRILLGISGTTSKFSLIVFGFGVSTDTVFSSNVYQSSYDISSIDAKKYSSIQLQLSLTSENISSVVKIDSLLAEYVNPPELCTNYQTVSLSKSNVNQGEEINLNFYVNNIGESTAKKFKVSVDLLKSDNSKLPVFETMVDSIRANQKKRFSFIYNTSAISGSYNFIINVDPLNSITEYYKDNNYYSIPFTVKADESRPNVQVKFDDIDIYDGDFISTDPVIKIELSDNSLIPITDTSAVEILLNNKRIYFKNNSSTMNYSFSNSNPKMIINYSPHYEDGEYSLKVIAKNIHNNSVEKTIVEKRFQVSQKAQLLYVYNYPNPFTDLTYFTFKLSQIPDELKIKIFTMAGRLIKQITRKETELNYDFNRVEWDGKDEDDNPIANGVYIYKVIMKKGSEIITATQKLAVVK